MIKVFWHETELGKGGLERQKKTGRKKCQKSFKDHFLVMRESALEAPTTKVAQLLGLLLLS